MEFATMLAYVQKRRRNGHLRIFACVERTEDITGNEQAQYVVITGVARAPNDPLPHDPVPPAVPNTDAATSARRVRP
jgi:hypothetical protein